MTIVVGYLWVAPPREAAVAGDGAVTWTGVRRVVGDAERVAIEFARRLAEASGGPVAGVTVGDPVTAGPQAAGAGLACGLDEAVLVRTPGAPETMQAAAAMARALETIDDVRLVVLGNAGSDSGTRLFGPCLAGCLGWPVIADVLDAEIPAETGGPPGPRGLVVRSRAGGSQLDYRTDGPAVLCVSAASCTPRQMGLRDIMAAARKPFRTIDCHQPDTGPCVVGRSRPASANRAGELIGGAGPREQAAALVGELWARGAL